MRFKMVHCNIKKQNLELINLKCVTYAQHIPLSLSSLSRKYCEFNLLVKDTQIQIWMHIAIDSIRA